MHRVVLAATLVLVGCTEGTTPDCSMIMCGPNLDGTVGDAPADAPAADAGIDTSVDAPDAPADAPADAPNDGG